MTTQQKTTTTSGLWKLDTKDFLRGLLMAVIGAVLTSVYEIIDKGEGLDGINWNTVWKVALGTAVTYLIKNFLTPGEVVITGASASTLQKIKEGEATAKVVETK